MCSRATVWEIVELIFSRAVVWKKHISGLLDDGFRERQQQPGEAQPDLGFSGNPIFIFLQLLRRACSFV